MHNADTERYTLQLLAVKGIESCPFKDCIKENSSGFLNQIIYGNLVLNYVAKVYSIMPYLAALVFLVSFKFVNVTALL